MHVQSLHAPYYFAKPLKPFSHTGLETICKPLITREKLEFPDWWQMIASSSCDIAKLESRRPTALLVIASVASRLLQSSTVCMGASDLIRGYETVKSSFTLKGHDLFFILRNSFSNLATYHWLVSQCVQTSCHLLRKLQVTTAIW